MRSALGGPRLLLRRLREISAEPINAQARLDKIVVQIAANMVAEVCSVYVLRADQSLELYATEGLKREAVLTRWGLPMSTGTESGCETGMTSAGPALNPYSTLLACPAFFSSRTRSRYIP